MSRALPPDGAPAPAAPGPAPTPPALATDLYQLTMAQAYLREGMTAPATFSLFVRDLPEGRNVLLACGQQAALDYLEALRFGDAELDWLAADGRFDTDFLDWAAGLRFDGAVRAVPEGTPLFGGEPLLEVTAPLPVAQLVESALVNLCHLETLLASKGARVVAAAAGRPVLEFGMRRMHGLDAALRGVRALWIAGVSATSHVEAARRHGIPAAGTMAHSYIQAHGDEAAAFAAFADCYPETTLLVDTWDTRAGVDRVIALARRLGQAFRVRAIRLDSGDLDELARDARRRLDAAGLEQVRILASGGLQEERIAALVAGGAPIDGFGVGTFMGVSSDCPSLDMVYKMVEFDGRATAKGSAGKATLPGAKQVWRRFRQRRAVGDVLALAGEPAPEGEARPLLQPVMADGRRLPEGRGSLEAARQRAAEEMARLPEAVRALPPARPAYPVALSPGLSADSGTPPTRG